jgi:hypothetical protein
MFQVKQIASGVTSLLTKINSKIGLDLKKKSHLLLTLTQLEVAAFYSFIE